MRKSIIVVIAMGMLTCPAVAHSQASNAPSAGLKDSSETFLGWQRNRGEAKALEDLRAAVAETPIQLGGTGDELAVKVRIADALFAAGIRRSDLRGNNGNGLVQNMADALSGRATTEQLASLSQLVVIATVGDRKDQGVDLGDGYLSTLALTDLIVLKGQARGNDSLIIRLLSGTDQGGTRRSVSFEDGLEPGRSYLFSL